MQNGTAIVVAGGGAPRRRPPTLPPRGDVVAADGGVDLALALGLRSTSSSATSTPLRRQRWRRPRRPGARVVRHPAAKDETDLELACDEALEFGPRRLVVVGGEGGRLDHLLAGLLLLGAAKYAAVEVDALLGSARAHVIRGRARAGGRDRRAHLAARRCTAPPRASPRRVSSTRCAARRLLPGSSRGVSNEFAGGVRRRLGRAGVPPRRPARRDAP